MKLTREHVASIVATCEQIADRAYEIGDAKPSSWSVNQALARIESALDGVLELTAGLDEPDPRIETEAARLARPVSVACCSSARLGFHAVNCKG